MENNNNENKGFSYSYSAREQAELKKIRDKYTPPKKEEDNLTRLRRLDASVTNSATVVALILGIVGALTLGFGMSLFMTELGEILVSNQIISLILGIIFGVIGIFIASLAWPIYNLIVKIRRKKLAPEIIRLADELMK